jgi:hypothetical protein
MSHETSCFPATAPSTAALRDERIWLPARHDSGAITPSIFKIVRSPEVDIAWAEHRREARR